MKNVHYNLRKLEKPLELEKVQLQAVSNKWSEMLPVCRLHQRDCVCEVRAYSSMRSSDIRLKRLSDLRQISVDQSIR